LIQVECADDAFGGGIIESVRRTRRALIVHEDARTGGRNFIRLLGRTYTAAGRAADAADAHAQGARWVVQTARDHVAPEFRDSFLHRNPVHRDLLAAAARESALAGQLAALRAEGQT